MKLATISVLAACGPALEAQPPSVHPPPGVPLESYVAGAILTEPELGDLTSVAVVHDDIYVVGCRVHSSLAKIVRGKLAWQRELPSGCFHGHHARPLAANERGPVVALGGKLFAFDPAGEARRAVPRRLSSRDAPPELAVRRNADCALSASRKRSAA